MGQEQSVKGKSGNEEKLSNEGKTVNEKNASSEEDAWSEDKLSHLCLRHGMIGFRGVLRTLRALERSERVVVEALGFGGNRPTVVGQL